MLIFEQFVSRGLMVFDPSRKVLTFNLPVIAKFPAIRQQKIEEFRDRFANPYVVADRGFVDAVIQPRETRKKLIQALAMLETKRDKNPPKKHGNIPL